MCCARIPRLWRPIINQFESAIRNNSLGRFAGVPSNADGIETVEVRNVRLDIEERRSVQNIHLGDKKAVCFDSNEANCRETDAIGTPRSSRGENAALLGIQKGAGDEPCERGAIEDVDQPKPIESLYVCESRGKFWKNFNDSLDVASPRALNGSPARMNKGRMDNTNGRHACKRLATS
jgi:hypothetical protein